MCHAKCSLQNSHSFRLQCLVLERTLGFSHSDDCLASGPRTIENACGFVFFLCRLSVGSDVGFQPCAQAGVPLWSHAGRRQINAACGVCLLLPPIFAFQRWHTSRFPLCWKTAYAPNWAKGFDGGWEVTWVVKHSAAQVITETHTPLDLRGLGTRSERQSCGTHICQKPNI